MRLLLFNPENDYALASGASFYTPPASVERMRRDCQLLPEVWAHPDDFILVDDPGSLFSRFSLVSWNQLSSLFEAFPELTVDPWGWNPALIRRLKDCGVPADRLPGEAAMQLIRSLSHRRTTVSLNSLWNKSVSLEFHVHVPVELTNVEECMDFYRRNRGCWMKAPWSSSGRGVINTAADMTPVLVEQWCRGIIRRQGSVMGETPADRVADFATEWMMESGSARYVCLSSFSTSRRGKYISNEALPQLQMTERFNTLSLMSLETVVARQKQILEQTLAGYDGPCGVDMIVERDGLLRPFVELNLRRTMGMLTQHIT